MRPLPSLEPVADTLAQRNQQLARLIARAHGGDIAAFEDLYSSTVRWLLGRIRRVVNDGQAEDILAEVYLQVWRNLGSFDESRGPAAVWLAMIARSRVYDHLRRERQCAGNPAFEPAQFDADGPEQIFTREQDARLLRLSMSSLSSQERLVLALAYFRDNTQREIATQTGLPLVRVRVLLGRARQKLHLHFTGPPRRQASIAPGAAAQ